MAYTSDFRVKLLMRDIQLKVTETLKSEGLENPLKLRIFDESRDDHRLWHDGGLTFTNDSGDSLGSNDAAWYIEESWTDPISKKNSKCKPVIVVEGSYGTETGNVGSAQKARFNHAVGMAKMGIIGAYVIPRISEYYRVSNDGAKSPPLWVTTAKWMPDIVLACLNVTQENTGSYLMIDAYNEDFLFNLVYSIAKNNETLKQKALDSILCEMKEHVQNYDIEASFAGMASQTVTSISDHSGNVLADWVGKILKHDERAFTTSQYRNGHIIWGEIEILHLLTGKNAYLILPRFTRQICATLDLANKKEWIALRNSSYVDIISLDDLIFESSYQYLINDFTNLRLKDMKGNDLKKMNKSWKALKTGLIKGKIKVNR